MIHSPEATGGSGFSFEDGVVAIYLGALLGEESAPGLAGGIVSRVAVQQAAFGGPLDDLIVDGKAADGTEIRLGLQIKRTITISSAQTNTDFREIVINSWKTLCKGGFREGIDRFGVATGMISDSRRRDCTEVCEWARGSLSAEGFFQRFHTAGFAGDNRRGVPEVFRQILHDYLEREVTDSDVYRILRHFVLIKFDVLHQAATDEPSAIERLRLQLIPSDSHRASDLWNRLRVVAREAAGRSGEINRKSLVLKLDGAFRLAGARSLRKNLDVINEEAEHALAAIPIAIDGIEIHRTALVSKAKLALDSHRFVNIVGLPGTGKSAVLRALTEDERRKGTVLLLKSDRLTGKTWGGYETSLGLDTTNLETLLCEIEVTGSPVLFIDGIDRIEVPNRGIVLDLLNTILGSSMLGNWKVLFTSRDNGIEPLRTWLPAGVFIDSGINTVEVSPFSNEESEQLAQASPALKPLLFGEDRVREVSRRPFFAAVLASLSRGSPASAPRSEVELIDAWWIRGGFDSKPGTTVHRQRALIHLAKSGAHDLGRRIQLDDVDLDALEDLKTDGVITDVRAGHTVQFAHDIFFEWSFLHLLMDRDDDWLEEIRAIGEPPVLGRTVELLSQVKFKEDRTWKKNLEILESAEIRPQWLRAWLIAPFGMPTFWDLAQTLTDAAFWNDARLLFKLAVWFQAEKTKANPRVLDGKAGFENRSKGEIVRIADLLAGPSDLGTWSRFCDWILCNLARCPVAVIPDLISIFEVWQNALGDIPNRISASIIETADKWLEDIEDRRHPEEFLYDPGPWNTLERSELGELEEGLRTLLLRSARVEQSRVHEYLLRVRDRHHLRGHVFAQIIMLTPLLALHHAQDVVDLTLVELKDELPAEIAKQSTSPRGWSTGFSVLDWHNLAIHHPRADFSPASPLREPFVSLFKVAPDQALSLVRELTNHAVMAWRQLFNLDPQRRGTPLPLTLEFPWGQQKFWGDGQVYLWSRGCWAPAPVMSGLMALEHWAFSEINRGRNVDHVIRDVLADHTSCAVLNIAAALALNSNHVSKTTLPVATSQKLWEWDIARFVQDGSIQANLIGFTNPSDQHAIAVRAENERPARRLDIRRLAGIFVLSGDDELRMIAQKAIVSFPEHLELSFKEEQANEPYVAELRRRAEIWSELGKIQNFSAHPAEDGSGVYIIHENPTASDPDVVELNKRSERMNKQVILLNWVHDSLERKTLSEKLALPVALEGAKRLDHPDLFVETHRETFERDNDQSAVAGVATIAILYGGILATEELEWASDVILRAALTPENQGEYFVAESVILHHPCLYSAHGLSGLVRRGLNERTSKEALIRLAGHPLDAVSVGAIAESLSLWDLDANFALIALNLGIRLSIGSIEFPVERKERVAQVINDVVQEFRSDQISTSLHSLPDPWIFAPPYLGGYSNSDLGKHEPIWRNPDVFLRWDFLPKILRYIPIAIVMNDEKHRPVFLAFCYDLLRWILERINPSWEEATQRNDRSKTEVIELRLWFFRLLGQIALYLGPEEAKRTMLEPIFALDDETAASVINPFANSLTAVGICDPPTVVPQALFLLEECMRRILKDGALDRFRGEEGYFYGYDLPELVRIFLFVNVEYAGGAMRFANGNWEDINQILPIIDLFVRNVGDIPQITSTFLTLCERAVDHYPPTVFVDQVTSFLGKQKGTPLGWRHTSIPSRIASLIYLFAERSQPLPENLAQTMLRVLDRLVDMGDRRSSALQTSEIFKNVRS